VTNLPGANLNSHRLARRAKTKDGFRSNGGFKRQPGRLFFGYFLFDCMDAGGRATQEQLPRRSKRK
jgi:hypothetical protein